MLDKERTRAAEVQKTRDVSARGASSTQSAVEGKAHASASSSLKSLEKSRTGKTIPPESIINFVKFDQFVQTLSMVCK